MTTPRRVLVAGGGFGRVHAAAVARRPDRSVLVGVVGRGGAASRELADAFHVPYHDVRGPGGGFDPSILAEASGTADLACVAVGSAISGGSGTDLTLELLRRGLHVLQEHPVHPDEATACAREARANGVHHRVHLHYRHLPTVRAFLAAAARLRRHHDIEFVDAAAPVHVLHPLVDILARALGTVRPWSWVEVVGSGPLRTVVGEIGGVPVTLRVQNQLDPVDRDNQMLLWHRIALGTQAGVLTLADTHGPVLWSPRWPADRDHTGRRVIDGPTPGLARPTSAQLPGTEPVTIAEAMATWWPDAVAGALDDLLSAVDSGADSLKESSLDLATARAWAALTDRLGPPETVRATAPQRVDVADLVDRDHAPPLSDHQRARPEGLPGRPTAEHDPGSWREYDTGAEFYDLMAAGRVAATTAPAVIALLRAVDPAQGPIVEIGAGTGLVTRAIAAALPEAQIIAAEPSAGMRAVLTGRIARHPDHRRRVTVTPDPAPDLELPDRISAAVLCGVAGHLEADDRVRLWRRLADRMPPGAPIVVELLSIRPGASFGPLRLGQASVGTHEIEWWSSCAPAGSDAVDLTSTWRVIADGVAIGETSETHRWYPITLEDLAAESGLELTGVGSAPDGANPGSAPLGVLSTPSLPPPS